MLGRGLESLIPPKHSSDSASAGQLREKPAQPLASEAVFQIEVDKIKPNPHQPRKVFNEAELNELAASIRELGIIQPLIVSKVEKDTATGTQVEYQLIAGERRLLAAKKAGLERVPVIVRFVSEEKEKLEMAVVENIQRTNLNPIEAARSYAKLQEEFGLTQREIAARIGKSRETISNITRLLNLPTNVQNAIAHGHISDSQGRLLLAVADPAQQQSLFDEITRNNLSVRELRNKISGLSSKNKSEERKTEAPLLKKDPEMAYVEDKLQEALGTKVSLQRTAGGGRIMISFFSPEEFKIIINKLLRSKEPDDAQQT